ncbi:MAG: hypothetical protein R2712_16855 [Vicinamibacterales bacterium]
MIARTLAPLFRVVLASSALALATACGSPEPAAPAAETPAAAPAETKPAAPAVQLIEPAPGSSSGHISLFRWSAVDGADGYRMQITAAADGRVVWDSPVFHETEAELPNTVALEPESYFWQVTALKGDQVLVASAPSRFLVTP